MFSEDLVKILTNNAKYNKQEISEIYTHLILLSQNIAEFKKTLADVNHRNMLSLNIDEKFYNQSLKDIKTLNTEIDEISQLTYKFKPFCTDKSLSDTIEIKITTNEQDCPSCYKYQKVSMIKQGIRIKVFNDDGSLKEEIPFTVKFCPHCKDYFVDRETGSVLKQFTNTNLSITSSYNMPTIIGYYDFIVISNINKCSYENHRLYDVVASIEVIQENGKASFERIPANYCLDCDRFVILKSDYAKLKGTPTCRVIDQTQKSALDGVYTGSDDETFFTQKGYNVNVNNNLPEEQRHRILEQILKNGEKTKSEICSYIESLIVKGSKIPSWSNAVAKWENDKNYISNLDFNENAIVGVNSIILKYRR